MQCSAAAAAFRSAWTWQRATIVLLAFGLLLAHRAAADGGRALIRSDSQMAGALAEPHAGADVLSGWHVGGEGWDFAVEVYRGDVMLNGTVPTKRDVRCAVETAWRVPGVRRVYADLVTAREALRRTLANPTSGSSPAQLPAGGAGRVP